MTSPVQFNFQNKLSRRTVLRGAGVALAVPWLSAMSQAFGASSTQRAPQRFVSFSLSLGLHAEFLNPEGEGRNYKPSRYLQSLQDIREKFTVVSGASHPDVAGGHRAEASILTAAPMSASAQTRNTISLDQYLAKHLGTDTRFPSLVLGLSSASPSYTENGSMIPALTSPSALFTKLFVNENKEEQARQLQRAREGRSIMDLVAEEAGSLERKLGAGDRDRLDAYFTSVRELEKRMMESEEWVSRPKPKVDVKKPVDINDPNALIERQQLMSDMIHLALSTDSTRYMTFHIGGGNSKLDLPGVTMAYHGLSHHGMDEEKLEQLAIVEQAIINCWADFLRKLDKTSDHGGSLLDNTSVLLTSNLGNASNHSNKNMPVLLAGGGFKHGQHLAFNKTSNYALPKLFVSVLQQNGLETDQFSTTKGTMTGLEPVKV
ncbi:DUF1552 domain-containing protein [Planctomicrobium sp. SH664]|uniref:DUF1552 domain-containing protein n=1 Tax=Planctomicrobium sp. SH664 TaxID=3448125 RepID=UPI003F5C183B